MSYNFHPIANILPLMSEEEISELAEDIKENGQKSPIVIYEGEILDGRNRYRACLFAGVVPKFEEYTGESPISYVLSLNVKRRHLTQSQKAAVAVEAEPFFAEEARERQTANLKKGAEIPVVGKIPEREKARARDQAAQSVGGVDGTYVSRAKLIKKENPDMFEKVKQGEITVSQAQKEIKKQEYHEKVKNIEKVKKESPQIIRKPSLLLADPPWKYDFAETENREIENHYQTATVEEMKSHLPETEKDCILFLWATAPKLLEALELMEAWGFKYITHAIWDKGKIGMGYWFRGQHELLLVGTKGNISPPISEYRESSIFREIRSGHSVKPNCVYEWIEKSFREKEKMEMYCRNPRNGWQAWGNEV